MHEARVTVPSSCRRLAVFAAVAALCACAPPASQAPDGGAPDASTTMIDVDAGGGDAGTPDSGTPDSGTPDAGGDDAGSRSVVFHSDFGTALGQSNAALWDTGKPVPWDGFIGNGRANEVIAATGLDFPSANVLAVNASWRPSPAGAAAQNHTLHTANGHLPVPSNGGSLFYRWYIRVTVPNSYTADPATHPIEDSPGTGTQNWNFNVTTNTDGTWRLTMQSGGNTYPNHRWSCPLLQKNQTYRVELQVNRVSDTHFLFHARVYDSSDALLYDDDDFANANNTATLASSPQQQVVSWANLAGFQCGFNGLAGGVESDFPFTLYYQGAFAISATDWLGPYRDGI